MALGRRRSPPTLVLLVLTAYSLALVLLVAPPPSFFVAAGTTRRFAAQSSAVVTIKKDDSSFFGSNAYDSDHWGAALPPQKLANGVRQFYPLVYTTASLTDPFGCTSLEALVNASKIAKRTLSLPANDSFILLVDRGHCSFTEKALYAQQLGAIALIVTDTPQQAYNRTRQEGATAVDKAMEYNCKNGRGDAAIGSDLTDFTSSSWADAVNVRKCNESSSCDSNLCIPTGKARQVCCLWDVADAMGFTSIPLQAEKKGDITIPVVKLKISDGNTLKELLNEKEDEVLVTVYKREPPSMDPSQFLLWLIAIVTVMTGGYKGAALERERALRKQTATQQQQLAAATSVAGNGDFASPQSYFTETGSQQQQQPNDLMLTGTTVRDPVAATLEAQDEEDEDEDATMDLTVYHALFFVVFATVFLLVLFYWNIVIVVIIFFAISSVTCSFYILWEPLFRSASFMHLRPFGPSENRFFQKLQWETWSVADMFAFIWSLAISLVWFINRNRQYAWLLQDLFGVCLCLLFLRTIRLPNLKIATWMLVLVFLYDIFMVFISPYIFHESVMIKAATGGSQAAATVSTGYCLRYPTDTAHNCLKEQMPILLRFPKVIDWRDGQSMLGLGDIVLPGLLVVFCARFDYATRGQLLGRVKAPHLARLKSSYQLDVALAASATAAAADDLDAYNRQQQQGQTPELTPYPCRGAGAASKRGLFGIMMWGYALGLLAANIGVAVMKQGQPALMYLVPSTLGTLCFVAWRRGILKKLWDGPEEFRAVAFSSHHTRSMTMDHQRERGFTLDHVMEAAEDHHSSHTNSLVGTTPQSVYSRPEDTPKA